MANVSVDEDSRRMSGRDSKLYIKMILITCIIMKLKRKLRLPCIKKMLPILRIIHFIYQLIIAFDNILETGIHFYQKFYTTFGGLFWGNTPVMTNDSGR